MITGLIYLLTGLFRCFTFLKSVLVLCVFLGMCPFHLGVLAFNCLLFVSTVIFYPRWQWCFHLAFNVFKECPTYSCFSVLKKFTRRKNKGDLHVSALWEIHRQDETDKIQLLENKVCFLWDQVLTPGTRLSYIRLLLRCRGE